MISVILSILKIIGIFILAVLGILLVIILAVLFVPIRYRINVEHGGTFELNTVVSWLFHIVHARYHHTKSQRRLLVRIFGIPVFDSRKVSGFKGKKSKKTGGPDIDTAYVNSHKDFQNDIKEDTCLDVQKTEPDGISGKIISEDKKTACKDEENNQNDYNVTEYNEKSLPESRSCYEEPVRTSDPDLNNVRDTKDDDIVEDLKDGKGKDGKIKRLINKIKKVKSRIADFVKNMVSKIRNIKRNLSNIWRKISLIIDFLRDEVNKEGFRFTYDSIIKLLKHIKPTRLKSRLIFGTGDPCSTGQILGLFGILYSFYGNDLNITPDFENKVFEGRHYARGRIRLWTVLIIIGRFLIDKRFKDLKMNYQLLKEAL